ncbi:MAG: aldo/keto reductase family oxidoreductase [Eubacteriales bacterium]
MKQIQMGGVIPASAISLGCMRMAGLDADGVERIMSCALESGINYFDHADIYGGGRSEELFGDYLKNHPDLRDKITVQTKCGIRPDRYDFSKEHILEAVDGSLKRLKTDHVDVLLLHRPDTLMEPAEVAEAFNLLQNSGKVRYFGVSNHNPYQMELLKSAVRQPLIANQLQYSVTECGMVTSGMNVNMKNPESVMHDGGLLEYCRLKNVTVQTWSPFQFGFFEGVFVGNREKFPKLNDKLDELAEKYGVSPTAIATAWILRHPAGMQVIAGTMNPAHLRDICSASEITLSREEWYQIYLAAGHRLP